MKKDTTSIRVSLDHAAALRQVAVADGTTQRTAAELAISAYVEGRLEESVATVAPFPAWAYDKLMNVAMDSSVPNLYVTEVIGAYPRSWRKQIGVLLRACGRYPRRRCPTASNPASVVWVFQKEAS